VLAAPFIFDGTVKKLRLLPIEEYVSVFQVAAREDPHSKLQKQIAKATPELLQNFSGGRIFKRSMRRLFSDIHY
jgi:hypothetical protein